MKPTSKELLEEASRHCSNEFTHYTFNKTTILVSDKCRDGKLSVLKNVGELTFYYLQKEKNIKHKFKEQLLKKMEQNSCLNDSEYKDVCMML